MVNKYGIPVNMELAINHNEPLQLKIDKLGRIVIPQAIREHLNLHPGSQLKLFLETDDKIILKVVPQQPLVERQDGVLVIDGKLHSRDTEDFVSKDREDRIQKILDTDS